MKRVGILIGRFQSRHYGHNQIIQQAAAQCHHLLILIGSANRPRSIRNPWTYFERWKDLRDTCARMMPDKEFSVYPLNDYRYNYPQWIADVEGAFRHLVTSNNRHFEFWSDKPILFGHTKPDTNYLKRDFPHWEYVELESEVPTLNATDIREKVFAAWVESESNVEDEHFAVKEVDLLTDCPHVWKVKPNLISDWKWLKAEKERFRDYPFPETLQFNCADAVVECAGHILLIERGNSPGKGVLALPGGFKEQCETFLQCAIRELTEEVNIRVPEKALIGSLKVDPREKVLRGSIVSYKMYDDPHRGHGIPRNTMAFHFRVDPNRDGTLPRVTPGDDAVKAMWFPFHDVLNQFSMHDDHQDIIYDLLGALPTPAHACPSYIRYTRTM